MTNCVPLVPGITVAGGTITVWIEVLSGFTAVRDAMLEVLGVAEAREDQWYPQDKVLRAYQKVGYLLGSRGLERFGRMVPSRALLPPGIQDAHTILSLLDATYHLNHRRDGVSMLDVATGAMTEGIGHYHYERADAREAVMRCDNPYPCGLDVGLFLGFAGRFEPAVTVVHEPGECRARGGSQCVYRVRW